METRQCIKCGEVKQLSKENFQYRKENGKFRTDCKSCNNDSRKKRYRGGVLIDCEVNQEFIDQYKDQILGLVGQGKNNRNIAAILKCKIKMIEQFFDQFGFCKCWKCKEIKEINEENFSIRDLDSGNKGFRKTCNKCHELTDEELKDRKEKAVKEHQKWKSINRRKIPVDEQFINEYQEQIFDMQGRGLKNRKIAKELKLDRSVIEKFFDEIGLRKCNDCGEIKELNISNFRSHSNNERGFQRICRNCKNAIDRIEYQQDPNYRLRKTISKNINRMLKTNHAIKGGQSMLNKLPYTINELWAHLESLFYTDPNLTRANYGSYWHLDHIDPHCNFPYTSMNDDCFKQCWALGNLRPLKAEININDNKNRSWEDIKKIKEAIKCHKLLIGLA